MLVKRHRCCSLANILCCGQMLALGVRLIQETASWSCRCQLGGCDCSIVCLTKVTLFVGVCCRRYGLTTVEGSVDRMQRGGVLAPRFRQTSARLREKCV